MNRLKELKSERIGLRLTKAEREAVVLMSREGNASEAQMVRQAIKEAACRRGLWPTRKDLQ